MDEIRSTSDMFHRFTMFHRVTFPVLRRFLPAIQAVCRVRDPPSHAAPLGAGVSQGLPGSSWKVVQIWVALV